jgi:N utilization substance protein B
MALPPQKFREVVIQMLFARAFFVADESDLLPYFMEEHQATKKAMGDALRRVQAVESHIEELDLKIGPASTAFSLERIGKVELSVLRLGIYELLYDKEVPPKVVLAEAVRLCRKYGTPGSAHFVNAVLDRIYKNDAVAAQTE